MPGIVLLHGSGPGPRKELRVFAERFSKLGFASLIFDKRGTGSSGGAWWEESLEDLADDALAAANFLRSQPGVDSSRIGVWGISQSGWVIPHAASRVRDAFAFAVIVTGGAITPRELEENDYAFALDRAGVNGEDRRSALALVQKYLTYLATGDDPAGMEKAIQESKEKTWYPAVDVGRVLPSAENRKKWEWVPNYDPATDIKSLRMPVLIVLAGKDRPALTPKWYQAWAQNLGSSGSSDTTIIEFMNAEHGAAMPGTHHQISAGGSPTFAAGYLDIVDAWLKAHQTPSVNLSKQ